MKKLEKGEVVVLENNEQYICCKRIKYQNKEYIYLLTVKRPYKVKFAEEIIDDDLKLIFVENEDLKEELLKIVKEKQA